MCGRIFYATKRIEIHGTPEQEAEWARMQKLVDALQLEVNETPMFETALERNIVYLEHLPEEGEDVTEQFLAAKCMLPMGFNKILLTHDDDGAVFRASN